MSVVRSARALVTNSALGMALVGGIIMLGVLLGRFPETATLETLGILFVSAVALRLFQLGLGKYAYISQIGIVSLAGALLIGPYETVLAVGAGTVLADWALHRKDLRAAWVNASREVASLAGAYGLYALVSVISGAPRPLSLEALPALAVLGVAYFAFSRALFYLSMLVRGKLAAPERLFIVRYEVVGYGITLIGAAAVTATVAALPPAAWAFVLVPLAFGALVFNRILEEAIEAEELNKIQGMDVIITSNAGLEDALSRIEELAHRILDWRDFRVYHRTGSGLDLLYRGRLGYASGAELVQGLDDLRQATWSARRATVINDTERDPRAIHLPREIRSLVIAPLRFGSELIGTLELDHHKRHHYPTSKLTLIETCARRIAMVVHIADLRSPLLATVDRVTREVGQLGELADRLRDAVAGMAAASEAIARGLTEQDTVVAEGLSATEALARTTGTVVGESQEVSRASSSARDIAERHRRTIEEAMERLIALEEFVRESVDKVDELDGATRRIVRFLASIGELADLTNILALNAAIEAARAGPHGTGFAEVAKEVRTLAEQSARTAAEAGSLVESVRRHLLDVTEQMRRGQAAVAGVERLSTGGLDALRDVAAATNDATDRAGRITGSADEQQAALQRLGVRIGVLADISSRNRQDAAAVGERARQVADGIDALGRAAQELDGVVAMLSEITRQFTEDRQADLVL